MSITQIKAENGDCNFKGWWQNELVVDTSLTCRNFDSGLNLYIAGDYLDGRVIDGEVRNYYYVRK